MTDAGRPGAFLARVTAGRSAATRSPLASVAAVVAFVVAFAWALANRPDTDVDPSWPLLVAAGVVGVLATAGLNAAEYGVAAALDGRRADRRRAFEVALLSSAANLLPMPGAALVRTQALRDEGASTRRAVASNVAVGVVWLAVTLVVAGVFVAVGGDGGGRALGGAFVAAGMLAAAVAARLVRRLRPTQWRQLVARAAVVELAFVVVGAGRLYLVLRGLGFDVGVVAPVALTVAIVAASAVGLLPGGLGLREALAAAIAPVAGVASSTGALAVAVDRLVSLPVLAVFTAVLALRRRRALLPASE